MSYHRVPTSERDDPERERLDRDDGLGKPAEPRAPDEDEEDQGGGGGDGGEEDAGPFVNIVQVGRPTLRVRVRPGMTVRELKAAAFPEAVEEGRNVRFIFQGRLLVDEKTLEESGGRPQSFVHCAITAARAPAAAGAAGAAAGAGAAGAGAGAAGDGSEDIPEWMLREAEMAAQVQENRTGSGADFTLGFVMGLLVGYFALCWVWSPVVPRRQKAGILLGMTVRLSLTIWASDRDEALDGTRSTGDPGGDDRASE